MFLPKTITVEGIMHLWNVEVLQEAMSELVQEYPELADTVINIQSRNLKPDQPTATAATHRIREDEIYARWGKIAA